MGAWGFTRNIINIDTFFAAPKQSESKKHGHSLSQKGGLATAEALEAEDGEEKKETPEQKRQREIKEKLQREEAEKEKLKK